MESSGIAPRLADLLISVLSSHCHCPHSSCVALCLWTNRLKLVSPPSATCPQAFFLRAAHQSLHNWDLNMCIHSSNLALLSPGLPDRDQFLSTFSRDLWCGPYPALELVSHSSKNSLCHSWNSGLHAITSNMPCYFSLPYLCSYASSSALRNISTLLCLVGLYLPFKTQHKCFLPHKKFY